MDEAREVPDEATSDGDGLFLTQPTSQKTRDHQAPPNNDRSSSSITASPTPNTDEIATPVNSDVYLAQTSTYWEELDEVKSTLESVRQFEKFVVGSALGLSTTLTVGYVIWMIRGGTLLASLLAQMPAWRIVDPLPILAYLDDELNGDDQESLESIADGNSMVV